MVEGYLKTRKNLKGVVMLIDSRHPPAAQDIQMYEWLKHRGLDAVVVATKADKNSRSRLLQSLKVIRSALPLAEGDPLCLFQRNRSGKGRTVRYNRPLGGK
jgi:GTP-binding protein